MRILHDPILHKPANIRTIRKLYQEGLLSEEAFAIACKILRPASHWFDWAKQLLLFLGCALILSGIIFFFAYNWAVMGKFLKFGLIEAGIIGCLIIAFLKEDKTLTSKILLLSASILVGVLLAVYGQIYQTGADAFGLFLGWAGLIFGWVIISEFAALWLIWLILLNTGAILFWQQVGAPTYSINYEYLCLSLVALNGIALFFREFGVQKGLSWLSGDWLRGVLLISVLVAISIPMIDLIIDLRYSDKLNPIIILAWIAVEVGFYFCYRYKFQDMVSIAFLVMNACLILLTLIGKLIFSSISDIIGTFLFFAFIIVCVVTGAVFLLKQLAKQMLNETKDSTK